MARTIGILLFDGAEEMDFAGPWEVFTAAVSGMPSDRVITIAERSRPITCEMGMRVIPDLPYGEAPEVDVVLVPGAAALDERLQTRRQQIGCATQRQSALG